MSLDYDRNLISLLQDKGITTRAVCSHNDSVPDVFFFKYKGLRSTFITQNYSFLPKLLGMDYNVFRYSRKCRGVAQGEREQFFLNLLNDRIKYSHALSNISDEIEDLVAKKGTVFSYGTLFPDRI